MGEALDKMIADMEAEKAAANPSPSPAPSPAPAAQPAQPSAQPQQPAAATPAQPSAAPAPAPASSEPATPKGAGDEQIILPQAKPVEPVLTPTTLTTPPALSPTQQSYVQSLYDEKPIQKEGLQEESTQGKSPSQVLSKEQELLIAQAQEILNDPLSKLIQQVRKSGGDINQLAKEAGLENLDGLSDEELIERELRANGTPETEIDAEVAKTLGGKSRIEINAITTPIRERQKADQQKRSAQYFANAQPQTNIDAVNNQARQTLEGLKEQFVGKDMLGLSIDDKVWSTAKDYLVKGNGNPYPIFNDKGELTGYDLNRAIKVAIFENYERQILKNHIELGKTMGFHEMYESRKRPSEQNTTGIETTAGAPDPDAAIKQMQEERLANRNNFKKDK